MFSHFFSFFSTFPCWGKRRSGRQNPSSTGTKASEFHSFFEDEKASRNLICRRSVNSDGGGSLSETWRGFLIIPKVFRKVFVSFSILFPPKQRNSGVDAWEFRIDNRAMCRYIPDNRALLA